MGKLMLFVSVFCLFIVAGNALGGDQAWNPNPADGDDCVPLDVILSWEAGDCIGPQGRHAVYFGIDCEAVNNATIASPEFMGYTQATVTTYNVGTLDKCTTYCWRIDEYCDPPGPPWSKAKSGVL